MQTAILRYKEEAKHDLYEIFKALLGLESELEFTEEAKEKLKTLPSYEDFQRNVLLRFYSMGSNEEQFDFVRSFSAEFPGKLSELGLPDMHAPKYKFNMNEEEWVIKKCPIDFSELERKQIIQVRDKIGTEKIVLKYLNNPLSYRVCPNQTQATFYSESLRASFLTTLTSTGASCDLCGHGICVHIIIRGHCENKMKLVESVSKLPPSFRSIFPELTKSFGGKKNTSLSRKKSSKFEKLRGKVREFPLARRMNKIYFRGCLLFKSVLHGGNVVLSQENLDFYNTKKLLLDLAKSNGIKGVSSLCVGDLRRRIFEELKKIAENKCVFCDNGLLGFCCETPSCNVKSVIMEIKGGGICLENVDRIHETINRKGLEDEVFLECRDDAFLLLQKTIQCLASNGKVLDDLTFNSNLFTIARNKDIANAVRMEELCLDRVMKTHGYVKDIEIDCPGDGLFVVLSQQLRINGLFLSPDVVCGRCVKWCRNNRKTSIGQGLQKLSLEMMFGGVEESMFDLKLKRLDNNVLGMHGEMELVAACNEFSTSILIISGDPTKEATSTSMRIVSPLGSSDKILCLGKLEVKKKFISVVKKDGFDVNDVDVIRKLFSVWNRNEKDRLFSGVKHGIEDENKNDDSIKRRRIHVERFEEILNNLQESSNQKVFEEEEEIQKAIEVSLGEYDDSASDEEEEYDEGARDIQKAIDASLGEIDDSASDEEEGAREIQKAIDVSFGEYDEGEDALGAALGDTGCITCGWAFIDEENIGKCEECDERVHKSKPDGLSRRCSRRDGDDLYCSDCYVSMIL